MGDSIRAWHDAEDAQLAREERKLDEEVDKALATLSPQANARLERRIIDAWARNEARVAARRAEREVLKQFGVRD